MESALRSIELFEHLAFTGIKVSIKSPDVVTTVDAYRLLSRKTRYPLHIGITEAGTLFSGTIKSAVGLGILLSEGIGDTLRVSLSADPVEEVRAGFAILKALGLRQHGPEIISCPTCGRCQIDVVSLARDIETKLSPLRRPIKIAVMGCEVNGPGEAREADIGIAGSRSKGVLFKRGAIMRRCDKADLLRRILPGTCNARLKNKPKLTADSCQLPVNFLSGYNILKIMWTWKGSCYALFTDADSDAAGGPC